METNGLILHFQLIPRLKEKNVPFAHIITILATIEKCYKLHGYPPGYKLKQSSLNGPINHISTQVALDEQYNDSGNIGAFIKTLNTDQYQQLMTMLSNHLVSSIPTSDS